MWVRCTLLSALLFVSCTDGGEQSQAILSQDTLENGAIHIVSAPEGEWAVLGEEPWRLEEDLRIGVIEGDPPYMFGAVRNVIPDPSGRMWVLDSRAHEMRLFDEEGVFLKAIGGEGQGPGEFDFNPCAFPGPGGEIWVEAGGRWQRFDTAGALLGGQQVTRHLGCGIRSWLPNGRFVAADNFYDEETGEYSIVFLIHERDSTGAVFVVDSVFPPDLPEGHQVTLEHASGRGRMILHMPFTSVPWRHLGPNADFWTTEGTGDYRIQRTTIFGDTLAILERPYNPIPIPDSIREDGIAGLRRENYRLESGFDLSEVPRTFPPIDQLLVGVDGTLWVRRQVEGGAYILDVFSPEGHFLGPVEAPADFDRMIIHLITPDFMYATARDELDVQYAVRLRIQRPDQVRK